jgi:hypothetical protein
MFKDTLIEEYTFTIQASLFLPAHPRPSLIMLKDQTT